MILLKNKVENKRESKQFQHLLFGKHIKQKRVYRITHKAKSPVFLMIIEIALNSF